MFDTEQGKTLLRLARSAIAQELGFALDDLPKADWLEENGATFVTLTLQGQLRGCIGSLEAHRPLIEDVQRNAVASAFRDPRFHRLTREEFAKILIEVSLLSKPETIRHSNEEEALAQLTPGSDGVIIEYGAHKATYLPQVWEQLPDPRIFLVQLKQKAGLPEDFWSKDVRLMRYRVQKWQEDMNDG